MLKGTLDGIQLRHGQFDMLDVLVYGYGEGLCWRASDSGGQLTPFLYWACLEWCSHTFACGGACAEVRGCHMDRLLLDHFLWLMVILHGHIPAIKVCVKLPKVEV